MASATWGGGGNPGSVVDLLVGRDGVDVRCVGGERQLHAVLSGVNRQLAEQPSHLARPAALQNVIKRVEPFARLDGIELRGVFRGNVTHTNSSACRL